MPLPNVSPELIQAYQEEISRQGSPSSGKRKLSSLKRFFSWAEGEGHIEENPIKEAQPIIAATAPKRKFGLSFANFLRGGILVGLIILIFLLLGRVRLPIPFRFAVPQETPSEITEIIPTPSPVAEVRETGQIIASLKEEITKLVEAAVEWATFEDGSLLIGGAPVSEITLSTGDTTDGDITINPDGSGNLNLIFEGNSGNQVNATAANLTSGSLYYGYIGNNSTSPYLLLLQSGSSPDTKFSVSTTGYTTIDGSLNLAGDLQFNGLTRLNQAGELKFITGYTQTSGLFEIDQGPGDFVGITKDLSGLEGAATKDSVILNFSEVTSSAYDTLVLKRTGGTSDAMALFVDEGNAKFDGQLQLGRFTSNPTSIGLGSLIFNTADSNFYGWDGSSWVDLTATGGGSDTIWQKLSGVISPITITDDLAIGGTTSSAPFFVDDSGNLTQKGTLTIGDASGDTVTVNSASWTFANDTNFVLSGGVNGLSFDTTTLSIDATNDRVGIGDTTPDAQLQVGAGTASRTLGAGDLFVTSDIEIDGILYLDGRTISNPAGTASLILCNVGGATCATTSQIENVLSAGTWMIENTANVGKAALIINQTKEGDLLTASASGVPRIAVERLTGDYKMFGPKSQTTIASINDVFVYDTTADADGGAWTNGDSAKASSWYNETIDDGPGDACVIATDDRCGKKEFPKRAVIEADASNVRIYNAEDQTMWMRFAQGTTALGTDTNNDPQTVFALNGRLYIGTSGSSTTGLYVIDLKADTIRRYDATNRSLSNQTVSGRNSSNTYTAESTIMKLPSAVINDVKAAHIDSKDYIAVGTNGGSTGAVTLIQEETKKISNFGHTTATVAAKNVYLTSDGTLYYTFRDQNSNTNDKFKVNYAAHKKLPVDANINATNNLPADVVYGNVSSTNRGVAFEDSTPVGTINEAVDFAPGPTFPDGTPVVNDLYVAKGTSTADPGRSATIYLATDDGLVRIDEYRTQIESIDKSSNPYTNYGFQVNETKGSVKYYTKDYITEAMYGDIKGMWPLNNANSASDFEDVSVKGNTLTGTNITAAGDSASGVRSTTTDFDGSTEYLSSTSTSLLPAAAITVGAWVNPATATTQKQVIAGKSGDTGNKSYRLALHGLTPYFEVSENGSDVYTASASAALTASAWNHVVGVFTPSDRNVNGKLEVYVNGALVARSTNAPNRLYNTPSVFKIGKDDQYHSNVSGTVTATTTIYNVTDANTIFKVGDLVYVYNTTQSISQTTHITAVSSTQVTVNNAGGFVNGDSVIVTKGNYTNPVVGYGSSTTVAQGVTQEDFVIGDLVAVLVQNLAASRTDQTISATTEDQVTIVSANLAANDYNYFTRYTPAMPKFGTALDATFKVITGPNQNEFAVGEPVAVSRAANLGSGPTGDITSTVVTAVSSTSITVFSAVGSVTTDDTWTKKLSRYPVVQGTSIDFPTSRTITGPNNTQFAVGDFVTTARAPDGGTISNERSNVFVTAVSATSITVSAAVTGAAATTDDVYVAKISNASTPTEYFGGKIDDAFVSASALTGEQIRTMFYAGQAALQNHTANRITGVTGADSYQQLAGAGASAATVSTVKAATVDDKNQFLFVGTNDSTTNTGGVSVLGVNTDTLHDLYDDTNNTGKDDDTGAQFDATDVVAISIHGPEPQYLAIAGTNDTTTKMWLESSNTSLKSHMANNIDPHGAFLNQTNLKVDNTLLLGESGQANLAATAEDVKLSGNLQITGKTVFGGNLLPNSYATGARATMRNLLTGSATWLGGQYNSIALGADNLPRIVHSDSFQGELYYMRCLKTDCSSYTTQLLDDGDPDIENDVVGDNSKIIIGPNNLPYIAYRNATQNSLWYIRCLDQDCSNRVKRMIDSEDSVASGGLSLAVNSRGFPIFAYTEGGGAGSRVRFATCADMDCNQVKVRYIGENSANVIGLPVAVALDSNDNPIMAYQEETDLSLWVTACSTPDCSIFSTTEDVVNSANSLGNDISIAIGTDNFPRIVYRDITATNYYFIKCTTANCSSITPASPGLQIDGDADNSAGDIGRTSVVMDASNNSYVAYWRSSTAGGGAGNHLGFVQVNDATPPTVTSGPTAVDDPTDTVGVYTWIDLTSSGVPVIAHRNVTQTGVRLTNCGNTTCTASNTSQDIYSHFSLDATAGLNIRPVDMAIGNDNFMRFAFNDDTLNDLFYARCLDLECTGWVMTTVASGVGDFGDNPKIAIGQDGFARIVYRSTTDIDLKYDRCLNDNCTSSTTTTFSDLSATGIAETSPGYGQTIAIGKDGFARISTFGGSSFDVFFIRCLNDGCTSFHHNRAVDTACNLTDSTQADAAMILDPNDLPIILQPCIQSGVTHRLYYAHCTDIDCSKNDGVTAIAGTGTAYAQSPRMVWSPQVNAPILSYKMSDVTTTTFTVCTDIKTCTQRTSTVSTAATRPFGLAIDPNTNLPVHLGGSNQTEANVIRCSDPYCKNQPSTTISLQPAGTTLYNGTGLIRQVDGVSQYVIAASNNGGLIYLVNNATIDIGNLDNPFGALFVSQLIARNTAVQGFDLAEDYQSTEPLEAGDVVSFDLEASKTVRKANNPYDSRLAGVVSTDPGLLLEDPQSKENTYPIALAGRVPVKIDPESEPIAIGDKLTSSNKAGFAKKATQAGYALGNALENWTCTEESCPEKIEVFVNVGFHEPDQSLTAYGDLKIVKKVETLSTAPETSPSAETPIEGIQKTVYQLIRTTADGGEEVINRFGAFGELVAGNIKSGFIETQELVAGKIKTDTITPSTGKDLVVDLETKEASESGFGKLIVKGDASVSGQIATNELLVEEDATVEGTLYADKIVTKEPLTYDTNLTREEIEAMLKEAEENMYMLAQTSSWDNLRATDSASLSELALTNLYVTGAGAFESLSSNNLSVGTDFVISARGNSIDTLATPLKLQSLALAPIEIMGGLVRIDTNGDVVITGNLYVGGVVESQGLAIKNGFGEILASIDASGSAEFNDLTTKKLVIASENPLEATEVIPGTIETNATAGVAILPAETVDMFIKNGNVGDSTLVYITPTSTTKNRVLYVKSKESGVGFTVGFEEALDIPVEFNWWIIELIH